MKIVIRAGGIGTRLWPYSRKNKPKQLFPLVSEKPMLSETIERAEQLVGISDIYLSIGNDSAEAARAYCTGIPRENIIIEPTRRDTAAAVGLESLHIAHNDPDAIVVGFASDHVIMKQREFVKVVQTALDVVAKHPDHIMTIGVKPTSPHTGYGYIEQGEQVRDISEGGVFHVRRFVEKPDQATAQQFLDAGNYLWNANIFVWNVSTILKLYQQFQPRMYEHLEKIESTIGTEHYEATLRREYEKMEKIAVEHAIIEKTSNILTIPADIGWSDIGDWASVMSAQPLGRDGNVVKGTHVGLDTTRSLVYGQPGKLVATVGLTDMIIVDTDDVLLVIPKDRAQSVKQLVDLIEKEAGSEYL